MISKYEDFIIENIVNESILYVTPSLRKVLSRINSDISKDLLSVIGTDIKPDVTFLDIEEDDYVKFSTMRNFKKSIIDNFPDSNTDLDNTYYGSLLSNLSDLSSSPSWGDKVDSVNTRARNKVKIGRLVNQIFPGKYTAKDLEEFVNKFKSTSDDSNKFEIVSDDDIEFWYNSDNYAETKGSLGSSCMASKKGIFDLYTKNENCRLLILKDGDKIKGRALVWKLDYLEVGPNKYEDIFFMDRQYTNDDSDVFKFHSYAKENGWAIKAKNSHSSFAPVIYKDEVKNSEMRVTAPRNLSRFPYVDTFRIYDPSTGKMFNEDPDDERDKYSGFYDLSDTSGEYSVIDDDVYSEYYGDHIRREDAVWSDNVDSYLDMDRAIRVSDDWFPDGSDSIRFSDYKDEWYLSDECVWSDIYDTYLPEDSSVECIVHIELNGRVEVDWVDKGDDGIVDIDYISEECIDKVRDSYPAIDDYKYVYSNILTKAEGENYAFDLFAIDAYKVKLDLEKSDIDIFLPKDIAKSLDLEIDLEDHKVTDCFLLAKDILAKEKTTSLFRNTPIITLDSISELDYYSYSDGERFINVINEYYKKRG